MATWNTSAPELDLFLEFAVEMIENGHVTPGYPVTKGTRSLFIRVALHQRPQSLYTHRCVLAGNRGRQDTGAAPEDPGRPRYELLYNNALSRFTNTQPQSLYKYKPSVALQTGN